MAGWDWQAVLVRVRLTTLAVFVCYFTSGYPGDVNTTKFRQILETKSILGLPSILIGDFNATPQEIADLGWPRLWRGHVLLPPVEFTCTIGSCRMIDFAICSESLRGNASLLPDPNSPWAPHTGLILQVARAPHALSALQVAIPKPPPSSGT